MKRALFIVCLTVFIGLPNLQPVLGKDAPASAPQLLKEFEAALKSKDKDALLALANWQGVSVDMNPCRWSCSRTWRRTQSRA